MSSKRMNILMITGLATLLSGCSYHQYYECPSPQKTLPMQHTHILPMQTITVAPMPVATITEKTTIYRVY